MSDLPELLTVPQLAELLQTSEKTVRRMVSSRRMPCVRFGRQIRFVRGDVFRWLEARKEG
jgi:excisionase family DNA binding protein